MTAKTMTEALTYFYLAISCSAAQAQAPDALGAYTTCMAAVYVELIDTYKNPVETAVRSRLACERFHTVLAKQLASKVADETPKLLLSIDAQILKSLREAVEPATVDTLDQLEAFSK
jgi:hypothetical protein